MTDDEQRKLKGENFARLVKTSIYSGVEVGRQVGVKDPNQAVQHWKKRSVPHKWARQVAHLLDCTIDEICITDTTEDESRALNKALAKKELIKIEVQELLSRVNDDTTLDRLLKIVIIEKEFAH